MNMRSSAIFTTAFILSACNVESAPSQWQMAIPGKFDRYQATLKCETPPDTGAFQQCQVSFKTMTGEAVNLRSVQIDGGMPAHGHGMPTAPVIEQQGTPGTYRIAGLKFTMPGAWLLGFQVEGALGSDQIIFDFVI